MQYITLSNIGKKSKFEDVKSLFIFMMTFFVISNIITKMIAYDEYRLDIMISLYLMSIIGIIVVLIEKCCMGQCAGRYAGALYMFLTPVVAKILDAIVFRATKTEVNTQLNLGLVLIASFSGILFDSSVFDVRFISASRSFTVAGILYLCLSEFMSSFTPIATMWPMQLLFLGALIGKICLILYGVLGDENYKIVKRTE